MAIDQSGYDPYQLPPLQLFSIAEKTALRQIGCRECVQRGKSAASTKAGMYEQSGECRTTKSTTAVVLTIFFSRCRTLIEEPVTN